MLGRKSVQETCTVSGSVPPMMTGTPKLVSPLRRNPPAGDDGKKKKIRNNVVDGILGRRVNEEESNDKEESIFPDEAKEFDVADTTEDSLNSAPDVGDDDESPSVPQNDGKEGLITPQAALVAPDVTPDAFTPLDPAQVPPSPNQNQPISPMAGPVPANADGAMDTILGRQNPGSNVPQQTAPLPPPVNVESFLTSIGAGSAPLLEAATTPGTPMPEHQSNDIRTLCDITRKFIR